MNIIKTRRRPLGSAAAVTTRARRRHRGPHNRNDTCTAVCIRVPARVYIDNNIRIACRRLRSRHVCVKKIRL